MFNRIVRNDGALPGKGISTFSFYTAGANYIIKTLIGVYVMKNILTVSTLRTLLNNSTYNYTSRTYTTMLGVLKK